MLFSALVSGVAVPSIQWWLFLATIPTHPTHWKLLCTCTITLTPLAGGVDIHTATGKGSSVLFLCQEFLKKPELVIICIHGTYSSFLPLPPLSPRALSNRLTVARWNRSAFQQQMLSHHLGLPRYPHGGCVSPWVTQQPALAGSQAAEQFGQQWHRENQAANWDADRRAFQNAQQQVFQPQALE